MSDLRSSAQSTLHSLALPRPLAQLLWMQVRGKLRRTRRKLCSRRRVVPTTIVLTLILAYIAQVYITLQFRESSGSVLPIAQLAPIGMFGILVMKLLGICVDRNKSGAGYRHEEVHQLLGGPFSLTDVRKFRVAGHAISILFTAVFAGIFFRFHVRSFWAAFSGAYLAMVFTYLVYSAIAVAAFHAQPTTYRRVRRWGLGILIVSLTGLLWHASLQSGDTLDYVRHLSESAIAALQWMPVRLVLSPFLVFTRLVVAEQALGWLAWVGPALLLNYVALQILLCVESACQHAEEAAQRTEFSRRQATDAKTGQQAAPRVSLSANAGSASGVSAYAPSPLVPWYYGAGPVFWRQCKAVRQLRGGLGMLLIPLGVMFALGGYLGYDPQQGAFPSIAVMIVLTSVFLPGLIPFDFRGDLTGLAALKRMPLRPASVVCGQILVPLGILLFFQLLALSTLLLHDPAHASSIAFSLCFLIPSNIIILLLENLVFLLYPYRMAEFDMQATIRRVVMLMMKFCVVFVAAIVALLAGLGVLGLKLAVAQLEGLSQWLAPLHGPLFFLSQFAALSLVAAAVFRATCWAYQRFDLSEDLPL